MNTKEITTTKSTKYKLEQSDTTISIAKQRSVCVYFEPIFK